MVCDLFRRKLTSTGLAVRCSPDKRGFVLVHTGLHGGLTWRFNAELDDLIEDYLERR